MSSGPDHRVRERFTEKCYIEPLNGDRQPLIKKGTFSAVTRDVTGSSAKLFKEAVC